MDKIGMVIEPGYNCNHFGVRNYFQSIKYALEKEHHVDYLMFREREGRAAWYRVNEVKNEDASGLCRFMEYRADTDRKINYDSFKKFIKANTRMDDHVTYYFQCLPEHIELENYKAYIITNPWLIDRSFCINSKFIYGLTYDFVANKYIFTEHEKPWDWSNMQRIGHEYYNAHCFKILTDSKMVADEYKQFYPAMASVVSYIPPFMPWQYDCFEYGQDTKKEKAIILAAPFDKRKGLDRLPMLINGISASIDCLYIFGNPRCEIQEFDTFFDSLTVKKIIYYPYIPYKELANLYSRCRFLLFPSYQEGLGLPLIEAQICGCRIVTTDLPPMNELGVEGSYYLSGCLEKDLEIMNSMMLDDFDYQNLSALAKKKYALEGILESFMD